MGYPKILDADSSIVEMVSWITRYQFSPTVMVQINRNDASDQLIGNPGPRGRFGFALDNFQCHCSFLCSSWAFRAMYLDEMGKGMVKPLR